MHKHSPESDAEQKYADILDLPHHVSPTRPQMSLLARAAQFSPFAALTGYEEQICETARLTDERTELSESENAELDRKLHLLQETLSHPRGPDTPDVCLTFFRPDEHKSGGAYHTLSGKVKKIDLPQKKIYFLNADTSMDSTPLPFSAPADTFPVAFADIRTLEILSGISR